MFFKEDEKIIATEYVLAARIVFYFVLGRTVAFIIHLII